MNSIITLKKNLKWQLSRFGMTLAKYQIMPKKFTYKELLLIVGVVVALAIATGFWLKTSDVGVVNTSFFGRPTAHKASSLSGLSTFLEKSMPTIKF